MRWLPCWLLAAEILRKKLLLLNVARLLSRLLPLLVLAIRAHAILVLALTSVPTNALRHVPKSVQRSVPKNAKKLVRRLAVQRQRLVKKSAPTRLARSKRPCCCKTTVIVFDNRRFLVVCAVLSKKSKVREEREQRLYIKQKQRDYSLNAEILG